MDKSSRPLFRVGYSQIPSSSLVRLLAIHAISSADDRLRGFVEQ